MTTRDYGLFSSFHAQNCLTNSICYAKRTDLTQKYLHDILYNNSCGVEIYFSYVQEVFPRTCVFLLCRTRLDPIVISTATI